MKAKKGDIISDSSFIREAVISCYKNLLGSSAKSLKGINVPAMRSGSLLVPVTHSNIDLAIMAIDDGKSPGIDGFNAHFF